MLSSANFRKLIKRPSSSLPSSRACSPSRRALSSLSTSSSTSSVSTISSSSSSSSSLLSISHPYGSYGAGKQEVKNKNKKTTTRRKHTVFTSDGKDSNSNAIKGRKRSESKKGKRKRHRRNLSSSSSCTPLSELRAVLESTHKIISYDSQAYTFQALDCTSNPRLHSVALARKNTPRANALQYEANVLQKLSGHKNILKFHSLLTYGEKDVDGVEGEDIYVGLEAEYCSKGTLKKLLHATTVGLKQFDALSIVKQILNGLKYANKQEIHHGNINLNTILVNVNNNIKLQGFSDGVNRKNSSVEFVAPEMLNVSSEQRHDGINGVDREKADIWSVGMTFFVLLTKIKKLSKSHWIRCQDNDHLVLNIKKFLLDSNCTQLDNVHTKCKLLLCGMLELDASKRLTIEQAWTRCNSAINSIKPSRTSS